MTERIEELFEIINKEFANMEKIFQIINDYNAQN